MNGNDRALWEFTFKKVLKEKLQNEEAAMDEAVDSAFDSANHTLDVAGATANIEEFRKSQPRPNLA
ncbi:MAG: hypothetical protein OXC08_18810 [Thiotrichales bacterium]|nr:hypothetical protein [Thiotrichales bacterium]